MVSVQESQWINSSATMSSLKLSRRFKKSFIILNEFSFKLNKSDKSMKRLLNIKQFWTTLGKKVDRNQNGTFTPLMLIKDHSSPLILHTRVLDGMYEWPGRMTRWPMRHCQHCKIQSYFLHNIWKRKCLLHLPVWHRSARLVQHQK